VTLATGTPRQKPALDEESFQQLLAAAYAVQEHKEALRAGNSRHDPSKIFSEMASLRSQVLALGSDNIPGREPKHCAIAAALVANCLRRLTNADGVTVCLITDGYLNSVACSGTPVKVAAGSVASNSLVPTERLRNMQIFQSSNASSDIRLDPGLCSKLHVGSLLAVPIERRNDVGGVIELRWKKAAAFSDWDERISQLMVNLMSEFLNRHSVVLAVQPPSAEQTARPRESVAEVVAPLPPAPEPPVSEASAAHVPTSVLAEHPPGACRVCGKTLIANDNYCGNCGMMAAAPDDALQSKWATMWFMQQAHKAVEGPDEQHEVGLPANTSNEDLAGSRSTAAQSMIASSGEESVELSNSAESSAEARRKPRSVLSVLKLRFKTSAADR
jgi:hypothetical protein